MGLLMSLIFLINFLPPNDQGLIRRVKNIPSQRDFTPMLTLLGSEDYLGGALHSRLNLLVDIYLILRLPYDSELVGLKLSELKQFYPILYPQVIKTKLHLAIIRNPLKRQNLIRKQLWEALPSHIRRKLNSLLQRKRSKKEDKFIKWLQENNLSIQDALYQLVSGLCEPILSKSNPLRVEVLDLQIEFEH